MKFRCLICNTEYEDQPSPSGLCSKCGGTVVIHYDYESLRNYLSRELFSARQDTMWRYSELLPIPIQYSISMGEGWTPLYKAERLGELTIRNLLIKNESLNPTGSFLDRGASVVVGYASMHKYETLHTDMPGNLGASLAAYAARSGIKCVIKIKEIFDPAKLYQMLSYGAELRLHDIYIPRNSYYVGPGNPYIIEGSKTIAYEIAEQLNWRVPDWVIVPAGNGGLLISIWKGFWELKELGLTNSMPKLAITQLSTCAPLVNMLMKSDTYGCRASIAKDIAIPNPIHSRAVIDILRKNGIGIAVSEEEVIDSMKMLARYEGILAEPAAATTLAGLIKLIEEGVISKSDEVVIVITGSGLKDPSAITKSFSESSVAKLLTTRSKRLGKTKLLILKLLESTPRYGYELMKLLRAELGNKISTATIYQHLKELEEMRLIELAGVSRVGGRYRKLYKLSKRGESLLKALSEK